jgi:hypothetical protein
MVNTTDGPRSRDDSDWQRAWDAIGQLAAARSHLESQLATRRRVAPVSHADSAVLFPLFGSPAARQEQLDQDLAEIAAVSHELRRVEPSLTPWRAPQRPALQARSTVDIWALMGIIWAAACLVGGAAAVAILHLA